jgi:hypothetical protein
MKQIITIILFATLCLNSNAQCNLSYKSLAEFGTDTVAFMTYNFRDRADCYKGKTLKEVSHDLEIPIKDFRMSHPNISKGISDSENCDGIWIYIYPYLYIQRAMIRKSILNSIYIEWETVIPENEYTRSEDGWTQEVFNYIKDKKVKYIQYSDRPRNRVNPNLLKD